MNKLLSILFAVLDCKVWNIGQLVTWSDQLIAKLDRPKAWLMDLSISASVDDALGVLRGIMKECGVQLPEDIGNLMAGLILLRFDNGDLSAEVAKNMLVDVVDAYGTSVVDAEDASKRDLNDAVYSVVRENAERALMYLTSERLLECERELIRE